MKLYINRGPNRNAWGGGAKFFNSLHDTVPAMGHQLVGPTMNVVPDAVLIAGLDDEGSYPAAERVIAHCRRLSSWTKLILRVNENDARKGTIGVDERLISLARQCDGTVFVSRWLRDHFVSIGGWPDRNNTVIINGVDRTTFKPSSKQALKGAISIATHHWSAHPKKGFDFYERLDDLAGSEPERFTFTYIGRERGTFRHTTVVAPLTGHALGDALASHDVYVSASRFDPGPNHIIESIACGLPTYVHHDGGGCVEFAGDDHAYGTWEELESILRRGEFTPNATVFDDWETCIAKYVAFIDGVA